MSLLSAILPSDIEGVKWAKLQRIFRQIADNAGISYALGFPLTDIQPSDTEGIKWQKLGAWAKLIADNIGGGGGDPTWGTTSGTTPAIAFTNDPQIIEWTLSGNSVPTFSGMAQGRRITLLITADGSTRNLTFPSWTWLEGTPATIAAGKAMQIDLLCRSTTAGSVIAVYGVQQ